MAFTGSVFTIDGGWTVQKALSKVGISDYRQQVMTDCMVTHVYFLSHNEYTS